MAERIQSVSELAVRAAEDDDLRQRLQDNPVATLQSLAEPLRTDVWIYRMVVGALGLTVLLCVIGAIVLTINDASADIPDVLVALGSAAVGAIAGLLAPAPTRS